MDLSPVKIQPLPPLNSLVAFESVARNQSFTLAAKELCVTQGAISRQIRVLEDYLGESLLERSTREVRLSTTGRRYYETVHGVLKQLAKATGEIRHWRGAQQITVMLSSAMASLWLLPKVGDFQRTNESIDLRIVAQDHVEDPARLDCDLALYYCRTPPPHMKATPLFCEEVFPVCSPRYLEEHPEIRDIAQLGSATWLWMDDPQSDWIGWPEWHERLGYTPVEPQHRVYINSYAMLIQSALRGQGVALAWSHLVGDHLETGALVRPLDLVLSTESQFCLLEPTAQSSNRDTVKRFRDWVLQQVSDAGVLSGNSNAHP
jgi:LysR family transcriptional regulator, glycine cleavage system transcriptional activator